MNENFNEPHEPAITLDELVARLHRRIPDGSEIVLVENRRKLPGLDRWIIGAAGERFASTEVWLPSAERDRVFSTLGRTWKPVWGRGDVDGSVPAAQVSWSIVWTLGPLPLRVWTRRGLVLSIGNSTLHGLATRGKAIPTNEAAGARAEQSLGGLRGVCVLRLVDGTRFPIATQWAPMRILGPLALLLGVIYDSEDHEHHTRSFLPELAERINEALAQSKEGRGVRDRVAQ